MQFTQIDDNSIFRGMVDGIPADVPGSFYSPFGVQVSALGAPPTDEPGKWRDDGSAWRAIGSEEQLAVMQVAVDRETSAAIVAGFAYEIQGELLHFSYDSHDQQNFADTANAATLATLGVSGVPQSVTWNGWRLEKNAQGIVTARQLVRLNLEPAAFLQLYLAGALSHKARCMEAGGQRKAALEAAGNAA